MRKIILSIACFNLSLVAFSQLILHGNQANSVVEGAIMIRYDDDRTFPDYILFDSQLVIESSEALPWIKKHLNLPSNESLVLINIEKDKLGIEHRTFQHKCNGIPVPFSTYKLHARNNRILSMNGQLFTGIDINEHASIPAEAAIVSAKSFVGASTYKWEIPTEEKFIKWRNKDAKATYYPNPELVIISKNGNYKNPDFTLCWKMEIYAHQPMSKQVIYVDAHTSEVVWHEDEICHADSPGNASTAYSGTRNIVSDSFGGGFRLRESGRGDGIETYDLNQSTNYGSAVDFTDADNNWNSPVPANDQYAFDAHWGAEMTYDYYMNVHGRNSIDGNGFALLSFIHYDVNYANAFWNGNEMTYGDGSGMITPLTTVDITGHEITHGLTNFTANLIYQDQSGALNESFSDIFGATIDNFARGTSGTALWRIGEECFPPNGIRLMNNPSAFGDPDTYEGTGWINEGDPFDNGGVHVNSGVQNYWYYLMCEGGTGVNDNADAFNVAGIGMTEAAEIAFRNLTVYLSPNSDFNDARFYAIISAQDLFGACSPQVETTTNAWYAVGVGDPYTDGVTANFAPAISNICTLPTTVNFINNTLTGNPATTYFWDFGDGVQSTQLNPNHNYGINGVYDVMLIANAGGCGIDTVFYPGIVNINIPDAPIANNYCTNTNPIIADITATGSGIVHWYSSPSSTSPLFVGNTYTTPSLSSNTTYYIENHLPNGSQNAGPPNNTFGSGVYFNSPYSEYLTFTVLQPINLSSVKVYSGSSGNRTIELWNGSGTPITSLVANIPTGESIVNLDWDLQPGNYRIGGTYMNLYKIGNGCTYPYTLPSLVSITGSSDGPNRYFYFYDWVVSSSCISERVPVIVNLNAPTANFTWTQNNQVVTFNNTSTNGSTYFWDFGGGATSNQANPNHDYNWGGTHYATLIVGNNGCFDTISANLDVIGIENNEVVGGSIYPIPFNDYVQFELDLPSNVGEVNIAAYTMLGEKLIDIYNGFISGNHLSYQWNSPNGIDSGIYLIKINFNGKEMVKRIVKI